MVKQKLIGSDNIFRYVFDNIRTDFNCCVDAWSWDVETKLNGVVAEVIENFDTHFFNDDVGEREKVQNEKFRKKLLKVVREEQQRVQGPLKKAMDECRKFT